MILRELMTSPVLKVTPGHTASDALALMRDENVRHAVVLLGSVIVGVVSDRDLGGPQGGRARVRQSVADLMHADPVVVPQAMPVEEAIHLVLERHIGCLPVVDCGALVGIVTRSDLLRLADAKASPAEPRRRTPPPDTDEERPPLARPDRARRP
jgi:acetoin utilization protein AcuB